MRPIRTLGKAVLLKFFQYEGRFPESVAELPSAVVEYVAQQLNLAEAFRLWVGESHD
jgi:hypothetical protein